jgi:DNA-binding LacI/PurR family transcriptional regulator
MAVVGPRPAAARARYRAQFERNVADRIEGLISKFTPTPYRVFGDAVTFHRSVEDALQAHADFDFLLVQKDRLAALALPWLQSQGRQVPKDTMVVGLDDDPSHYQLGLSRFEVDWERIGYLMAHALIGDFRLPRTPEGFVRPSVRFLHKLTTVR